MTLREKWTRALIERIERYDLKDPRYASVLTREILEAGFEAGREAAIWAVRASLTNEVGLDQKFVLERACQNIRATWVDAVPYQDEE